jgi:hypothetical protein
MLTPTVVLVKYTPVDGVVDHDRAGAVELLAGIRTPPPATIGPAANVVAGDEVFDTKMPSLTPSETPVVPARFPR